MKITHKITGATLFESEAETMKQLLEDAYLRGADLRGAHLRGAHLRGADLRGADLRDAYLRGADLRGADLRGADLRGAYLRGAYLRGADLRDAYLRGADLRGADLRDADLRDVDLRGAYLRDADLRDAKLPYAPKIENIDSKILAAIESGGTLDMEQWHSCETTHCRAGWAIHLTGDAGKVLEGQIGPANAGVLIYMASRGSFPDFYADDATAMADIKACAAKEKEE